jgi:hypothetical protein
MPMIFTLIIDELLQIVFLQNPHDWKVGPIVSEVMSSIVATEVSQTSEFTFRPKTFWIANQTSQDLEVIFKR